MKIGIIGQGYVGSPLSVAFAKAGVTVVGFDKNSELVQTLNSGVSHIEDIKSVELVSLVLSGKYKASDNPKDIDGSTVIIIAVPTPLDSKRNPDLSFVESASKLVGENLSSGTLIINESTSYPGTLRNLISPIVEKYSSVKGLNLYAVSPERVDPGNKKWNLRTTPRILSGLTQEGTQKAKEIYSLICDQIIEVSSPEVAESAKLFENTFRQVNIALVNEFARITDSLNISVREVLDAANSKPYGFMKFEPGIGVGGHCIPVDPTYLAYISEKNGIEPRFIKLANQINLETPSLIIKKIEKTFNTFLKEKNVLVCGLSYKSNISDVRESPSKILGEELMKSGARVDFYDPNVEGLGLEQNLALNYHLAIIAVGHDNFNLEEIRKRSSLIFDVTGKFKEFPTI